MSETSDQAHQEWSEARLKGQLVQPPPQQDAEAIEAYHRLFTDLAKAPSVGLSAGFSGRVVHRLQRRELAHQRLLSYLVLVGLVGLVISIALGVQAWLGGQAYGNTLALLRSWVGPIVYSMVLYGLVQGLDYWLVKRKQVVV